MKSNEKLRNMRMFIWRINQNRLKMLDADKKNAFELVNSGHNMIICGQAGVGKTHLVKHIVQYKRKEHKHVSVVCSTGIAATHYGNLGSQTLHK
jgi:chromosomal replication initiation ATPase DnaA